MIKKLISSVYRLRKVGSTQYFKSMSSQDNTNCTKQSDNWLVRARDVVPALSTLKHKGEAGRVGIVGGSLEYTGAPYYAAISALSVGADLVHVFCKVAAGPALKAYSPELIVHPILDVPNALEQIEQWLPRLHVIVIGPGMGRAENVLQLVIQLIQKCRSMNLPLIIDADGLFLLIRHPELVHDYSGVILTPNEAEFQRLFGSDVTEVTDAIRALGTGVTILRKGLVDRIYDSKNGTVIVECPVGGSARRCGGQGDLLAGAIAAFYCWVINPDSNISVEPAVLCWAGSVLAKECNKAAFAGKGRGMLTTDMIPLIPSVFRRIFDSEDKLFKSTSMNP